MFGQDRTDDIETLPMVPLRDVVVFPHMMIPFVIGRSSSIKALDYDPDKTDPIEV
jgi:ATP-dependent Lon protease